MQLLAVGLNHTTAPVALRERLAFAPEQLGTAVAAARNWFARADSKGGDEAAILSTCNRTELYAASNAAHPLDAGAQFLADFSTAECRWSGSCWNRSSGPGGPRHKAGVTVVVWLCLALLHHIPALSRITEPATASDTA